MTSPTPDALSSFKSNEQEREDNMRRFSAPPRSRENSVLVPPPRRKSELVMDTTELTRRRLVSEAKYTYESLDFQEVENDLLHEERLAAMKKELEHNRNGFGRVGRILQKVDCVRYLVLMMIGLLTGVIAFGIDKGIEFLSDQKWDIVGDQMETDPTHPGDVPFTAPYFLFSGINLFLGLIATLIVVYIEPLAAGSGIPEVKCFLNGVRIYRMGRVRTLLAKCTGILFSVASGLPCGKEGPMIHAGAIVGGGLASGKSSKLHLDTGLFKKYRNDRDKTVFITAGAAAGVAAAFGAPIGGVLFAVEEVGSFWNIEMAVQVFFASSFSALGINMCRKWSDPLSPASGQTNFGAITGTYRMWELPLCFMLGVIGGLVGALFNALNIALTKWRKEVLIRDIKWRRIAEALVINFCVSSMLFLLVARGYLCKPPSQLPNGGIDTVTGDDYKRTYGCNATAGDFNNMATLFFDQGEAIIRHSYHSEQHIDYNTLFMHFLPNFILTVMTYGIAVPSGLFLPCLALGSSIGRIYGQLLHDMFGFDLAYGLYASFGSAAVLAGVVRMTVSLSVILIEATGNPPNVVPLMLVTCVAKFVGDLFNEGIYDEHIQLAKIPILEYRLHDDSGHNPGAMPLNLATAQDVMNDIDVAFLPLRPKVQSVLQLLSDKPHHNCFVVTTRGTRAEPMKGIILRRCLLILLSKCAWGAASSALSYNDFVKSAHERRHLKPQTYALTLSSANLVEMMDLARYIDSYPFTVRETTPLPRTYRMFRDLGLRHLVVVNDKFHAVGLIARKCLVHLHDMSYFEDEEEAALVNLNGEDEIDFTEAAQSARGARDSVASRFHVQRHPSAEIFRFPDGLGEPFMPSTGHVPSVSPSSFTSVN
ncbi:Chloride channel protein C [Diplonema papillatum]|nr:Chloride channel protein C [Diplonema papillatum]|eukprot:gene16512-25317_t